MSMIRWPNVLDPAELTDSDLWEIARPFIGHGLPRVTAPFKLLTEQVFPFWFPQALDWERFQDTLGPADDPYMERWYLQAPAADDRRSVRLHKIIRDDAGVLLDDGPDEHATHCHPWDFAALIVSGSYRDHAADGTHRDYRAGDVVRHAATDAHRLEVLEGPVWTVVVTGRKIRKWGFHTRIGWRYWRSFRDDQLNFRSTSKGT